MAGLGRKGDFMFSYVEDKEFLSRMRNLCGEIMQDFCHYLKEDYDIGAVFYLVGSGAKNLIVQNASLPIDLDYNLEIVRCEDFEDCGFLRECARKTFNKVLNEYGWGDCKNSTSSLTTKKVHFVEGNPTEFSMDVCIVCRDTAEHFYRLKLKKTGFTYLDEYYWNEAPHSAGIQKKAKYIKERGKWQLVRTQYLDIKNRYLRQNDHDHPSFICYIEAVNNVYNARMSWR